MASFLDDAFGATDDIPVANTGEQPPVASSSSSAASSSSSSASSASSSSSAMAQSSADAAAAPAGGESGAEAAAAGSSGIAAASAKAEDAQTLQFSPEMVAVKAEYLSNVEAAIVLDWLAKQSDKLGKPKEDEAFTQSLEYATTLSFRSGAAGSSANLAVEELRNTLESKTYPSGEGKDVPGGDGSRLHKFEVAALTNLRPAEPEEARALMPSLDRFDDSDLRDIINAVTRCVGRLEDD